MTTIAIEFRLFTRRSNVFERINRVVTDKFHIDRTHVRDREIILRRIPVIIIYEPFVRSQSYGGARMWS